MGLKRILQGIRGLCAPEERISLQKRYPQYEIGKWSYGDPKILTWGNDATCKIGAFCSIADGVKILLCSEHRADWVSTYPFNFFWKRAAHLTGNPATKGDVIIGNDVWIGYETMILSGVTIGNGAVIGARSLVTKDVPPYSIYAGHPARLVRMRFDEEAIHRLLDLQWWSLPDERIERLVPLLLNADINVFLDAAEREKRDSSEPGK